MAENERVSFKKAVSGLIEPKNYIKAGVFSFNIGIMVLLVIGCIAVFNFFFAKKGVTTQKQTTSVQLQKGSKVDNLYVVSNQEDSKKKSVGLEGALTSDSLETVFVKYINDNLSAGVGIRYNFNADDNDSEFSPVVKVRWDFL